MALSQVKAGDQPAAAVTHGTVNVNRSARAMGLRDGGQDLAHDGVREELGHRGLHPFEAAPGGTRVTSRSTYVRPEDLQAVMDMGMLQGITETWDRLAEHLA